MFRNPKDPSQIMLSEFIKIAEPEEESWLESPNIRILMIALAIIIVFAWRYLRSASSNIEDFNEQAFDDVNREFQSTEQRKRFKE
jgi:hypothetical protein